MNNSLSEGETLASSVLSLITDDPVEGVELILIPPFVHLSGLSKMLGNASGVFLGAQNCSNEVSGAFTGEVSASMIKSTEATHVIVGHSERREYFGETDELLATKVDRVLENDLIPIFCCGEPLEVREAGDQDGYVTTQIERGLFHLDSSAFSKVIVAYEPIWAIGTGHTATSDQAQAMHAGVRSKLAEKFGAEAAAECSILYGGSCKPDNAPELFAQSDVDGGLIGGASLKAEDFVAIARSFS